MIKKLHLTCKNKLNLDNNNVWAKCVSNYKHIYSDYEIIIYDNNDIYRIIQNKYPEYLERIKKIKIGAILADIFRYLILYEEGGIYSDMDCSPLKKIDTLFTDTHYHGDSNNIFYIYPPNKQLINNKWDFYSPPCNNCSRVSQNAYKCLGHSINNESTILCYEFHKDWHYKNSILHNNMWTSNNVGICQWFMITKPKQEVFKHMFMSCLDKLDILINLTTNDKDYHFKVINTCGPLAFTKMVQKHMTDNIYILPSDFFCSGSWANQVPLTKNSYIKHHFTGSWTKK
jgi:hypothetical protein